MTTPMTPRERATLIDNCTTILRGADYLAFVEQQITEAIAAQKEADAKIAMDYAKDSPNGQTQYVSSMIAAAIRGSQ
jgi:hypothetical protein